MQSLSAHDISRLRLALRHCGRESFFLHLQRLIKARLRVDTLLLLHFPVNGPPQPLHSWLPGLVNGAQALAQYCDGAYRLDPFYQLPDLPAGGRFDRLSAIAPDRFFAGEYYLQYFRQTRLCDELGFLVPLPDGSKGHLSLSRLSETGRFKRKEVQCIRHYSPLVLEMLQNHLGGRLARKPPAAADQEGERAARPLHEVIRAQVARRLEVALTARETEVTALVLQGHSNASAAMTLKIARETVKVHRRNIYRKLRISSQAELFSLLKDLL